MPITSSSSSVVLIAGGTLAFGSLVLLSRRFLNQQRRFNIRRLDLTLRVARKVLLVQAETFSVDNDGNGRQLRLAIRIGGISVENALMILLILKWLIMPTVFFEMMEKEVDFASVMYLSSLRFPLITFAITDY